MPTESQTGARQQRLRPAKNVLLVVAVGWMAGYFVLAWAIFKRPILGLTVAAYVGLVVWIGWHDAEGLMLWALIILALWRWLHRPSFNRLVGCRLRRAWRRLWVYERSWRATMMLCGLGQRYALRTVVPKIRAFHSTAWGERVLVGLVAGQCTEDIERVAPELAHSFAARACRVREDRPGRVWLEFATGDPLIEVVSALAVPELVDLHAVAIGLREDGEPWRLRLLGTHLLIAGATGSGKGSVLWSLLRGLAPAIRDGRVVVWAIDPKGGMELAPRPRPVRPLLRRRVHSDGRPARRSRRRDARPRAPPGRGHAAA